MQLFIKNLRQIFFVASGKTTTKFSIYYMRRLKKTAGLFKTLSKNTSGDFSRAERRWM